jgi:hypothetical protein
MKKIDAFGGRNIGFVISEPMVTKIMQSITKISPAAAVACIAALTAVRLSTVPPGVIPA